MEDAVGHLKGVSRAKFGGVAAQKLDVVVKNGEWVELEEVWRLIERQGYRVRKENTHLKLRGTASKIADSWFLTMKGSEISRKIPIEIPSRRDRSGTGTDRLDLTALRDKGEIELDATVSMRDKVVHLVARHIQLCEPDR